MSSIRYYLSVHTLIYLINRPLRSIIFANQSKGLLVLVNSSLWDVSVQMFVLLFEDVFF